jgi:hypothetical protein
MEFKKFANPCLGAAVALQFAEFGHVVHPCAPGPEELRCQSLPPPHMHFPEPQGSVIHFTQIAVTTTLSTGTLGTVLRL